LCVYICVPRITILYIQTFFHIIIYIIYIWLLFILNSISCTVSHICDYCIGRDYHCTRNRFDGHISSDKLHLTCSTCINNYVITKTRLHSLIFLGLFEFSYYHNRGCYGCPPFHSWSRSYYRFGIRQNNWQQTKNTRLYYYNIMTYINNCRSRHELKYFEHFACVRWVCVLENPLQPLDVRDTI